MSIISESDFVVTAIKTVSR